VSIRGGPSPALERIVGAFIPPACREEILGDLCEKYLGSFQYIGLAITVIPFVILSRIRRTRDLRIRLTDALLIYGSFLAAAWCTPSSALPRHDGLIRVAIPATVNVFDLVFQDIWAEGSQWARVLVFSLALGIGIGFNPYGEIAGTLLVGGLRSIHGTVPGVNRPIGFAATHVTAKGWLMIAAFLALNVWFLANDGRPGRPDAIAVFFIFLGVCFARRPRKS